MVQQSLMTTLLNACNDFITISSTPVVDSPITIDTSATSIFDNGTLKSNFTIQNTNTQACFIKANGTPTATVYDYILSADSGAKAGAGGKITFTKFTGELQGLVATGTTTVAVANITTSNS